MVEGLNTLKFWKPDILKVWNIEQYKIEHETNEESNNNKTTTTQWTFETLNIEHSEYVFYNVGCA